jgi:hypothetical protein
MQFFSLTAGLLLGWRAGLLAGILTPWASFALSGMPVLSLLPQITVEMAAYGLVSGLLGQRAGGRTLWALVGAMVSGRLALGLAVFVTEGSIADSISYVWAAVDRGYTGMLLQGLLVPPCVALMRRWLEHRSLA